MREKQEGNRPEWLKKGIVAECALVLILAAAALGRQERDAAERTVNNHVLSIENDYIKWVDFTVSYEALCKAYEWDVETHGTDCEIDWVELLAYTAAKTGGEFGKDALKIMDKAAGKLSEGEGTMEELAEDLKYYPYYKEAYDAAIGGLVGEYWEVGAVDGGDSTVVPGSGAKVSESGEMAPEDGMFMTQNGTISPGNGKYEKKYGLKGYFPLARGFDYTHFDDFGVGRSYGYQRKHLGLCVNIVSVGGKPVKSRGFADIDKIKNAAWTAQRSETDVFLLRKKGKKAM